MSSSPAPLLSQSTPKTLLEAIRNGMALGPLNGLDERIHAHIVDFLAQRFGAAMLRTESEEELKKLFDSIVRKD